MSILIRAFVRLSRASQRMLAICHHYVPHACMVIVAHASPWVISHTRHLHAGVPSHQRTHSSPRMRLPRRALQAGRDVTQLQHVEQQRRLLADRALRVAHVWGGVA